MAAPMLETKNLGISFGGLKAVDELTLTINKGQLYGLIGPNGAGKTTAFNLLTGVYKPTEGNFFLDGEKLTRTEPPLKSTKRASREPSRISDCSNSSRYLTMSSSDCIMIISTRWLTASFACHPISRLKNR